MSEDASQRLDELKLLWESDPSSKVYLQLASVYRQKGQLDKAVEVLETSLQHRPRDPRGRVALARCKMEQKDHGAAAELLEEVIRQDAAHMEANKQLLECYLQMGDAEKAEERLNIYKLLNDRDPELDHLEYRLSSLQDGEDDGHSAVAESPSAESQVPDLSQSAEAVENAPPETLPPADSPSQVDVPVPAVEAIPAVEATSEPPLAAAAEPEAAAESISEDLGSEPVARDEESVPAPPHESAGPEQAEPELASPALDPAEDDLFELEPTPAADEDPWGGDLFDLAAPSAPAQAAEPDLAGLWEQTEIVELDDGEEDETADAAAEPAEAEDEAAEVEVAAGEEGGGATATLGLMYLRQGHLDEAEAIFRQVLAQHADNEAALAGLAQLETLRHAASPGVAELEETAEEPVEGGAEAEAAGVHVEDLRAESPESVEGAEVLQAEPAPALTAQALLGRVALESTLPADATGRKIALLQQYIQQIRTASGDHVH